jgi:type I restriction enzyme S subunit
MDGVPEGWKQMQVKNVLEKLNRPKKIKQSEYLPEGPIPCVDQSRDFIGGYTYDEDAVIDIGRSVIVFGDHTRILKYVDFPFACGADGTQLIVSNDPGVSQEFLYFALDAIDLTNYFYARHFKFLKDQFIPRPKDVIISQFSDVVRPTLNQIKLLSAHCERLAKARDLLLPRLMKGVLVI